MLLSSQDRTMDYCSVLNYNALYLIGFLMII